MIDTGSFIMPRQSIKNIPIISRLNRSEKWVAILRAVIPYGLINIPNSRLIPSIINEA